MRNTLILLLFLGFAFYIFWQNTGLKENFFQWRYDISSGQKIITNKEDISKVFDSFSTISFSKFDKEYLEKTHYGISKYTKLASDANFLIVKGKDIFKFVVGDFRIKDFLPKDDFYYNNIDALGGGSEIIWAIDKKLLFKILELQDELVANDYDETGFWIVNGFRHPHYNEKVGGAKMSRHLIGQAVDIQIDDINKDGYADQSDKKNNLRYFGK